MTEEFNLTAAQRRVFESGLGAHEKLVTLALLDHWSRARDTYPSVERLKRWTGLSRSAVLRSISKLRTGGTVTVSESKGRANRYDLTPIMRLQLVPVRDQCPGDTSTHETPHQCHTDTPPVSDRHGGSVTQTPEGIHEGTQEGIHEGTQSGATKKRAPKRTKKAKPSLPELPLPEDWEPSDKHRAFATKHNIDIDVAAFAFRGNAEKNDRRARSWNGAFATWLGNAVEFSRDRAGSRQPKVQQGLRPGDDVANWGRRANA